MISLFITFTIVSCYLIYSTSEKTPPAQTDHLLNWIQKNKNSSRMVGFTFLIITLFVACLIFGVISGILTWLFLTITLFSLMILLIPIRKVNVLGLVFILIISFIFENIF